MSEETRSRGEPPPGIELRASGVEPESTGIWSKLPISAEDKFGPFEGERVQEAHADMNPSYVWEIVDLETKEHLWYIDATDPSQGNWMRNIKCARFLEEQNIIARQEGTDIYYRAMKDIPPGVELLTWYEKVKLKKGRKRRKNTPQHISKHYKRSHRRDELDLFEDSDSQSTSDEAYFPTKKTKRQLMRELSQSNLKSMEEKEQKMQQEKLDAETEEINKPQEEENIKEEPVIDKHAQTAKEDEQIKQNDSKEIVEMQEDKFEATNAEKIDAKPESNNQKEVSGDRQFFRFEIKEEHIIRNRLGRKVFLCDICSGLYKHSFSLKRHYIKHHLNHMYVTEADLVNCHITKHCVIIPNNQPMSAPSQKRLEEVQSPTHCSSVDKFDAKTENTPGDRIDSKSGDTAGNTSGEGNTSPENTSFSNSEVLEKDDEKSEENCSENISNTLDNHESSQLSKEISSSGDNQEKNNLTTCSEDTNMKHDSHDKKSEEASAEVADKSVHEIDKTQTVTQSQDTNVCNEHTMNPVQSVSPVMKNNECNEENGSKENVSPSEQSEVDIQNDNALTDISKEDLLSEKVVEETKGEVLKEKNEAMDTDVPERIDSVTENKIHENRPNGPQQDLFEHPEVKEAAAEDKHLSEENQKDLDKSRDETIESSKDSREIQNDSISSTTDMGIEIAHDTETDTSNSGAHSAQRERLETSNITQTSDQSNTETTFSETISGDSSFVEKSQELRDNVANEIDKSNQTSSESCRQPVAMPGLYRCNTCNATFDDVEGIRAHIKHHPEDASTAKLLSCDQCDMKFTEKKNLSRHQASHNSSGNSKPQQHWCKFCAKQFTNVKSLRRHERSHGGEQRQTCEHCATSFSQSCDLRKHIRRTHPTCFHECAYCTIYFSSKKLLVQHLVTHDKKLQDNKDELSSRKDHIEAIDPVLDKAESMRLAGKKYGKSDDAFKYACTVCKKRFIDYTNMCRHRRMAHMRHLMDTLKTSERRNVRIFESTSIIRTRSAVEREMVDFYACVSDNIQDNLSNHMMGTKSMVDSAANLVKWDLSSDYFSSFDAKKEPGPKANVTAAFLSKCNFPKTFRMKDPDNRFKEVNTRKTKHQSYSLMRDKGKDCVPSDETELSNKPLSKTTLFHDLATLPKPIHLPSYLPVAKDKLDASEGSTKDSDVKTCAVCKITFSDAKEYRSHMREKHGVHTREIEKEIEIEKNKASNTESKIKTNPLLKVSKPDINIPVTLQHEKAEQEEVVDLSGAPPVPARVIKDGATGTVKRHIGNLGLVTTAAGKVVMKVPENVCTEDPSEKFHRYLCKACHKEFSDWPQFMEHHNAQHPTIERGFSIIDPSLKQVWTRISNPVGLLNVCSSHVAAFEPRQMFHCTKCHKRFKVMPELHKHMLTCADPETLRPKYVWVYQYRKQKYSKMKRKRTCEWQKSVKKSVETDPNGSILNGQFEVNGLDKSFQSQLNDSLDGSQDGFDDGKKRRRKPFEVTYNPTRHTRRRQMNEIVDTSICGGCGEDFKTISLLERHIPVCSHKEKIRELEFLKSGHEGDNSDSDSSDDYDPNKHLCIYCLRQFTYLRSLRNHIFEICSVRKEFVATNEYLDEEWEQSLIEKTGGKKEPPTPLSRQSSVSSLVNLDDENSKDSTELKKSVDKRQRRRRRGFGWAHKNKPNAYNRTIKQVVSEDGFIYEYYVESETPIISFDLSDTFILDVDKDKEEEKGGKKKPKKSTSQPVGQENVPLPVTTSPYIPRTHFSHHDDAQAEDLSKPSTKVETKSESKDDVEKASQGKVNKVVQKVKKSAVLNSGVSDRRTRRNRLITDFLKSKKSAQQKVVRKPKSLTKTVTVSTKNSEVGKVSKQTMQTKKSVATKEEVVATKKTLSKEKPTSKGTKSQVTLSQKRRKATNAKAVLAKCVKKKLAQKKFNGAVKATVRAKKLNNKTSTPKMLQKKANDIAKQKVKIDHSDVLNEAKKTTSPASSTDIEQQKSARRRALSYKFKRDIMAKKTQAKKIIKTKNILTKGAKKAVRKKKTTLVGSENSKISKKTTAKILKSQDNTDKKSKSDSQEPMEQYEEYVEEKKIQESPNLAEDDSVDAGILNADQPQESPKGQKHLQKKSSKTAISSKRSKSATEICSTQNSDNTKEPNQDKVTDMEKSFSTQMFDCPLFQSLPKDDSSSQDSIISTDSEITKKTKKSKKTVKQLEADVKSDFIDKDVITVKPKKKKIIGFKCAVSKVGKKTKLVKSARTSRVNDQSITKKNELQPSTDELDSERNENRSPHPGTVEDEITEGVDTETMIPQETVDGFSGNDSSSPVASQKVSEYSQENNEIPNESVPDSNSANQESSAGNKAKKLKSKKSGSSKKKQLVKLKKLKKHKKEKQIKRLKKKKSDAPPIPSPVKCDDLVLDTVADDNVHLMPPSPQKQFQSWSTKASLKTMLSAWNEAALECSLKPVTKHKSKKVTKKDSKQRESEPYELQESEVPLEPEEDMFTKIKKNRRKRKIFYVEWPEDSLDEGDANKAPLRRKKKMKSKLVPKNKSGVSGNIPKPRRKKVKNISNGPFSDAATVNSELSETKTSKMLPDVDETVSVIFNGANEMLENSSIKRLQRSRSNSSSRNRSPVRKGRALNSKLIESSPQNASKTDRISATGVNEKSKSVASAQVATPAKSKKVGNIFEAMGSIQNGEMKSKASSSAKNVSKFSNLTKATSTIKSINRTPPKKKLPMNVAAGSIDLVTNTVCKAFSDSQRSTSIFPRSNKKMPVNCKLNTSNNSSVGARHKDIYDFTDDEKSQSDFDLMMDNIDSGNYSDATEPYDEYEGEDSHVSRMCDLDPAL